MNHVLWSSNKSDWETPQSLFDLLDSEFHFDLDLAASSSNSKCLSFFSLSDDALLQDWSGHVCWCNPPYSRRLGQWIEKAYLESCKPNTTIVMLVPSRTDTLWFHKFCLPYAEIRFLRGRLRFGSSSSPAPFGSMILVFSSVFPIKKFI